MIRYAERIDDCTVLGPGGKRAVLWVHGCCFNCKGCIADSYKTGAYIETSPTELAEWCCFQASETEGMTISGGEPFLQAGELAEMIRLIRKKRDFGVIVYTGFLYEELIEQAQTDEGIACFLAEIDLLIDGPYMESLDRNRMAVGSENQRILPLTDRYQNEVEDYYGKKERHVEIRLFDGKTMLVGVPAHEQTRLWKRLNGKPSEEMQDADGGSKR